MQIDHSLGFAGALELAGVAYPGSFVDLGTGGGLPGLVLLGRWPGSRALLLDASTRRTAFLRRALASLSDQPASTSSVGQAEVRCQRAEDAGRAGELRGSFDVVVARSFGSPAVTAECAAPFLKVGGHLVVSEPPADPISPGNGPSRWPSGELAEVGLAPLWRVEKLFGYQVLRQETLCPDRYPRRVGVPAKRPLYRLH